MVAGAGAGFGSAIGSSSSTSATSAADPEAFHKVVSDLTLIYKKLLIKLETPWLRQVLE